MSHTPYGINRTFAQHPGAGKGVDINTPAGRILCAPFAGYLQRRNASPRSDGRYFSYGWYWRIDHGNGLITRGAHLSAWLRGDGRVVAGEPIAKAGGVRGAVGAGNSTGDHLHYEWEIDGERRDPLARPGRLGSLFHPLEAAEVTATDIKYGFLVAYGKPWWQAPTFYARVRDGIRRVLEEYVRTYHQDPASASPNFLRKFLNGHGIP